MKSNLRNEIKPHIVRSGYTMQEADHRLSEDHGGSDSVSNQSNKVHVRALREVGEVQVADDLGHGVVGQDPADIGWLSCWRGVAPVPVEKSAELEIDGRGELDVVLYLSVAGLKELGGCRDCR